MRKDPRGWSVLLVLGLGFLLVVACHSGGIAKADWFCKSEHYEFNIQGLESQALHFVSSDKKQKIHIKFVAPSENKIDFFLFDAENFQAFSSRDLFSTELQWYAVEDLRRGVASGEITFELDGEPYELYAVFYNGYSTDIWSSERIEVDVERCTWMIPPSLEIQTQAIDTSQWGSVDLEVTIRNKGEATAENVIVSLSLPDELSATQTTENLGDIEGYESQTFQFSVNYEEPGTYSVIVQASADNTGSTTKTVSMRGLTPPALSVTAQLSTDTIEMGELSILIVEVKNTGEFPAENVEVLLELPSGLSTVSPVRGLGSVSGSSNPAVYSIEGITPGTYTIQVMAGADNAKAERTTIMLNVVTEISKVIETSPTIETPSTTEEGGGIPGFEVAMVLLSLPVVVWFRRRSQ